MTPIFSLLSGAVTSPASVYARSSVSLCYLLVVGGSRSECGMQRAVFGTLYQSHLFREKVTTRTPYQCPTCAVYTSEDILRSLATSLLAPTSQELQQGSNKSRAPTRLQQVGWLVQTGSYRQQVCWLVQACFSKTVRANRLVAAYNRRLVSPWLVTVLSETRTGGSDRTRMGTDVAPLLFRV